jgi:heme iron utilization protein
MQSKNNNIALSLRDKLVCEIQAFKQQQETLLLATVDLDGLPNVSYAPFAPADEGFYILVSDLARHGGNLRQCKNVSVMMIEDEARATRIFARKRLTFDAVAQFISRDTKAFLQGVMALSGRFGTMPDNLAALADFNLYLLVPTQGLFVKGFGQAFSLTGAELMDIDWQNKGQHGRASSNSDTGINDE